MTGKQIGLFVTGGIAAYKVPLLVRALIRRGHSVRVAMTQAATRFVTPETLATVSKQPVLTDNGAFADASHVAHVEFANSLDMAVVVPATANTIAKMAMGIADNEALSALLAFAGPKLVVPAMNDHMWENAQTQANVHHLQELGMAVLPPATGFLAEGYAGVGRMPDLPVIEAFIQSYQATPLLAGKKILISSGGTKERIDPVRYIGNDSSGKMGAALANVAAAAGAEVILVTTATQPVLTQVQVVPVSSAREMGAALTAQFEQTDALIMAAAVADFRPDQVAANKIKKQGDAALTLQLAQNPDLLAGFGAAKTHQVVVGFAAETTALLANATAKLARKHADLLVANQVGAHQGFNQETDAVTLLWPDRAPRPIAEASKTEIAAAILAEVATLIDRRS
ncbi:bifunctional phosphopantothenoylcysteine decarboxylase/phosphopantothenate--cysteine ligase CoaBC [Lacticaseibacillus yichunensis]|uniref:Coenzyme A biosynthesis bifunctional protein CoaBC n=2 Tax=Bacilli TaxID=91061 RepID=A0ABW4CMA0_9LACO|nr:bifunctional phosphopantothenoylcysteine decarboxylase/phosphopantothenate--cysteine ligase CoaBC [Lacticaseibacillus yichunensis]